MRLTNKLLLIVLLVAVYGSAGTVSLAQTNTGDGIPNNCEHAATPQQLALFPRYEPHNSRLLLVDWTTGDDILQLATDIQVAGVQGWSVDCRYLAVAAGTLQQSQTVVFDIQTGTEAGRIPDAGGKLHPVTWGPGGYLVVETRTGAILWHVPSGRQHTLTTSFNNTTMRNFSRLRWDAANQQLIANLAVGGRVIYDVTTGQDVPEAAIQTNSRPRSATSDTSVFLGGRDYPCQERYQYGYRNRYSDTGIPYVQMAYDAGTGLMYLELVDINGADEPIVMLEDNLFPTSVRLYGERHPSCRYRAASLWYGDTGETVVYDAVEARRVGSVPDARLIDHPILWSETGNALLVETRTGAILWHLPSNTQTRLNDAVEIPLAGNSDVRNFALHAWSGDTLFAVPLDATATLTMYTVEGNQQVITAFDRQITGLNSVLQDWLTITLATPENDFYQTRVLLNPQTRQQVRLDDVEFSVVISPGSHYVAARTQDGIGIWSLTTGERLVVPETVAAFRSPAFIDDVTLRNRNGARYNIETGMYTPPGQAAEAPPPNPLPGESGSDNYFSVRGEIRQHQQRCDPNKLLRYDATQNRVLIPAGTNRTSTVPLIAPNNPPDSFHWSSDCRYISAFVPVVDETGVPYDDAPLDAVFIDRATYDVVFWDARTGAELGRFSNPHRYQGSAQVLWNPSGTLAWVLTTEGYFIFNPATGDKTLLTYPPGTQNAINTRYEISWDMQRGRLITSGWDGVLLFDIRTGNGLASLQPDTDRGCPYTGCGFLESADYSKLLIFGERSLTTYDLYTLNIIQTGERE